MVLEKRIGRQVGSTSEHRPSDRNHGSTVEGHCSVVDDNGPKSRESTGVGVLVSDSKTSGGMRLESSLDELEGVCADSSHCTTGGSRNHPFPCWGSACLSGVVQWVH